MYDRRVNTLDEPMEAIDARAAAASWRPQQVSKARPAAIEDPIIEPLWTGLRVLALIDDGRVTIRDLDGDPVDEFEDVAAELAEASRASQLLVDGYLTDQPTQGVEPVAQRERDEVAASLPTMSQMWFGKRRSKASPPPVEEIGREPLPPDAEVAIVLVDLLWLDDEPLLAIPLLERKRILESVVDESRLVRRGIFVRPPIDTWLGSWRSFGFSRLVYKAANSRYTPGATNSQWAIAELPRL
jgi:ATP-dependent DNA ligase